MVHQSKVADDWYRYDLKKRSDREYRPNRLDDDRGWSRYGPDREADRKHRSYDFGKSDTRDYAGYDIDDRKSTCTGASEGEVVYGGRYALGSEIASGSFGTVYNGLDLKTGSRVAIKTESLYSRFPQLPIEAKLYKELYGAPGVPTLHWYGVAGERNIVVIDLLGKSLEQLLEFCGGTFSLKTVLMLADQLLTCIQRVHSKHFMHRDIKPDNFLMGAGPNSGFAYIIDFGLSKKYWVSKEDVHIPYREGKAMIGTARYASIGAHLGIEQSRRDDLEAIGYMLIYFLLGSLPWQGLQAASAEEKQAKIRDTKLNVRPDELCNGFPVEFELFLLYVRKLGFEDCPDYDYMRSLFTQAFECKGYTYDFKYDWDDGASAYEKERTESASAKIPKIPLPQFQ